MSERATTGPGRGSAARRPARFWRIAVAVVAVALQLVVLVPFTVASGLVAPGWAVVAFYVLWLACAAVLVVALRRRPSAALLVPLANAALLWLAVTAGDIWLGWTA